jgi:hypothetical protein
MSADEMLAEDQQKINTFSKLNTRLSDIQDQLKTKLVSAECGLANSGPRRPWESGIVKCLGQSLTYVGREARSLLGVEILDVGGGW